MGSKIRSSKQLFVDASFDFNSQKGINQLAGVADTDSANVGQMNTAIANAISGVGNSVHAPVADLAACKAIAAAGRADKMVMLVESLGLYRFDAESSVASNDTTVIRPTDIASDASAGRWLKISSTLTDHDLLSNILGNGTYHLSLAERDKLTGIEALADVTDAANVGTAINGSAAKTTPVDADTVGIINSVGTVLNKVTWANIKATLKTYFDTLYNLYTHPNHSGDVTSVADGATTIAAKAVTLAKMADVATASFIGRNTAATGVPEVLPVATVKTMLGIGSQAGAVRSYRVTPTGTVNGSNTTFTIAALILTGTEEVFLNGMLQNAGAGNDYTISYGATTTITFLTAPSATGITDVILVNYSV